MLDISPEQNEFIVPSSSFKKRKRDSTQTDLPNSINTILPSHFHSLNSSFRLNCSDLSKDNEEFSPHLQCLPRKRRVLQQPYPYSQQQPSQSLPVSHQSHPNSVQNKHLPSALCIPTSANVSSPPVSPKTLVPRYPAQQNFCTSASVLRSCHICHRKPNTRELVEAYADCDLCNQRTCYICLRRCDAVDCIGLGDFADQQPWGGALDRRQEGTDQSELQTLRQSRKICSSCAVEGITETGLEVVRCLDCAYENHH
ncbi:hypothetical protein P175DRAFT_04511 [Aspergillus ochraceoroseus IBT 24754]|uniref:Uncharacterized protein n=1 Tax=Aspergillus ochraceoroseus IBT 24754 TaxID=1392256 RepID=A0A2T5M5E1_9EURO|nr:uncharacterized protein P175DRAFT_04511 [Aspergillus ochraceoroseus IBT 24754]PTU23753.1 hypothetical protein P175DRAFT_04511 [Aspergillus ochraceoroseus IBT 24754]